MSSVNNLSYCELLNTDELIQVPYSEEIYQSQNSDQNGSALVIEEIPLAISFNGINHAVMMVTPNEVEAFLIGFSLTEGIIETVDDIRDIELQAYKYRPESAQTEDDHAEPLDNELEIAVIAAEVELSPRRAQAFRNRSRQRRGNTGCGLCGIDSLPAALPPLPTLPPVEIPEDLEPLREKLFDAQALGRKAGAIHAAMLLDPEGNTLGCYEDIGRHNALDKLIGASLKAHRNLYGYSAVMSSRCSAELIQKALRAGISTLIHMASPSHLAVQLARRHGLNLIHLPRRSEARIYSCATSDRR